MELGEKFKFTIIVFIKKEANKTKYEPQGYKSRTDTKHQLSNNSDWNIKRNMLFHNFT